MAGSAPAAEADGMAPTPYSAEDIRSSHPVGATVTYEVSVAGQPPMRQRTEWLTHDGDGCTFQVRIATADDAFGEPQPSLAATWAELRDHASFPANATTITREQRTTPAGTFDCMKYVVDGGEGSVMTFWFDTASAGSPVEFVTVHHGSEIQRMVLLESTRRAL